MRSALTLGVLTFGLVACADNRAEFPAQIELEDEIASSSSGLFMEACSSAEYRLSDSAIDAIEAEGLAFFLDLAPAGDGRRIYGNWTETPLAPEERRPWGAFGGCGDSRDRTRADQLDQMLRSSGSYYAFTENHEGMLLIAPGMRLAAFFYVG